MWLKRSIPLTNTIEPGEMRTSRSCTSTLCLIVYVSKTMKANTTIVIGAGPIGLETTAHLKKMGVDVTCVDAGSVGGTIFSFFPPNTRFFSSPERLAIAGIDIQIPTEEKATREDYLAYLRSVARTLELPIRTHERVIGAARSDKGWTLRTLSRSGQEHELRAVNVVLAIGGTHHHRRLGISGEDMPHVDHELGDPHRFFGRDVVIVGGKNSAAEAALRCWRAGARVHLVHRGPGLHERVKYWIKPEVESLMKEGLIGHRFNSVVTRIEADAIHARSSESGEMTMIPCQDVLLMIGYEQDPALFRLFEVSLQGEQNAPCHDPLTMETNQKGVYVAGTASAGSQQRFRTYIENSHIHAGRIAAHITGTTPPQERPPRELPEA